MWRLSIKEGEEGVSCPGLGRVLGLVPATWERYSRLRQELGLQL
jgi:hypothetical protein